jgi:hypothetical protein
LDLRRRKLQGIGENFIERKFIIFSLYQIIIIIIIIIIIFIFYTEP